MTRDTGWFKSSRSGSTNDACVEVRLTTAVVRVRDSKNHTAGVLAFAGPQWKAFLGLVSTTR